MGKYLRLKVLVKRVGAIRIMEKYGSTQWIIMLLEASAIVGSTAIGLITETLRLAKIELENMKCLNDITQWRSLWMDAVCRGFVHHNASVRKVTTVDLLKYILRVDVESYFPLIQHILKRGTAERSLWKRSTLKALVGIL